MTKKKRILSVIMAVALVASMMFAMTATTYAVTDSEVSVTVKFYDGDEFLLDREVRINPSTMTNSNWNALYQIPALVGNQSYHENLLMNNQRPSAMDATILALQEMGSADGTQVYWDYGYPVTNSSTILGGYITDIFGQGTVTNTALTTPSLWVGDAWLYSITTSSGTVVPNLYATNVALQDGMTITWTYTYGIEEPIN